MQLPLPPRIGRYEVVDRLGRGGMGVVYLAKDPVLGRTVALKMLTEDNEELRERFAREARSAAALDHVNIVTIYDVGQADGHPFIAMKYLDGETMAELIRRQAPITLGRKLELMDELCAGLGYAHRSGIVHRDIKPANLMITTDGTLKILDFGIARVNTETSHSGLTQVGTLMGSPHYMSPEQAEGLPVDERSDIFSVGLVFYELISFSRAFPGDLAHVVLHNIIHKEPRRIRELIPDIDPELERIVAKGIVKDPAGRYQTLAELASDLKRVEKRFEGTDETVVINRDSHDSQGKSKTGGSGARSFRNWEEVDGRRKALIESHLAEAAVHLDAGRNEEVIDQCEKVLIISPEEPKALEMLQRAHRGVDERQVQQWLAEAQTLISRGAITEAERLVGQAIQLQPDSAEGQAAVAGLKERRREQERAAERARSVRTALTKARANMEAGAFEAAMRSAGEALAYEPDNEQARQLIERAREALEERNARIAHDKSAREVVERARQSMAQNDCHGALTILRAFSPPHPTVAALIAEFEEAAAIETRQRDTRAAQKVERHAERQSRSSLEANRPPPDDDERREQSTDVDLPTEVRRQREPERDDPTLVAPMPRARIENPGQVRPSTVEKTHEVRVEKTHHPWYRRLVVTGPVAALLVGGLVTWLALRGGPPLPVPPERPPAVDFARVLAEAESQGNALAAIALLKTIPATAREFGRAESLQKQIRNDAAGQANAARQTAEAAGATSQDAFRGAQQLVKQADAMPDAESAVNLYEQARESFVRAAGAGLTVDQLLQRARDSIRRGNSREGITYAVQAFRTDSTHQAAIALLTEQRQQAALLAQQARQRATAEGAAIENSTAFKAARSLESTADRSSSPPDTQKAVDAYGEARGQYERAYASARDAKAVADALRRADQRLRSRDAAGARTAMETVQSKDPNNGALPDLRKRLTALDAELEKDAEAATAAAAAIRQAAEALKQSVALDDSQAIVLLEQASKLDPTNGAIQTELERRRKSLAAVGRTGGGAGGNAGSNPGRSGGLPAPSPTEAVQSALREFAATYKGTKNNEQWLYTSLPAVKFVSATEAVVPWNVTVVDTNAQGTKKQERRRYEFVLKQSAQVWKIETFSYKGSW